MEQKKVFFWERLLSLLTCLLMLAAVALQKNGTLFGHQPEELFSHTSEQTANATSDTLQVLPDGTLIVNTQPLAPSVIGYGGPTPLQIHVRNGIIEKIESGSNSETPDFYTSACENIFPQYIGHTVDEALAMHTDAVSGATYSSSAIIENLSRGLTYVQPQVSSHIVEIRETPSAPQPSLPKIIASIIVILMGVILPNWFRSKGYRLLQLLLNIIVLGCWCGTFVSYSLLVNYLSNGVNLATAIIALLLVAVALLMPLFGRPSHYCSWLCPFGSTQEFIYRITPFKIKISPTTQKWLTRFRWALWSVLMLLMWTGVWFEWMNYELFTIFLFQQAGWFVITLAAIFGILSIFISRPYCRFVCPTGALLQTL